MKYSISALFMLQAALSAATLAACGDSPDDDPIGLDELTDASVSTEPVEQTTLDDAGVDATAPSTPVLDDHFRDVYALLSTHCVSCHGAGKQLDVSSPELAHRELVGIEARYKACASDGGVPLVRVVPGAADSSLLVQKLEGRQSCGKQMPMESLSSAQIAVVRAWISAGAELYRH